MQKSLCHCLGRFHAPSSNHGESEGIVKVKVICSWKVHRITTNHTWTVYDRLMTQRVRQKPAVTQKELEDELKAAGTTVTVNNKQ